MLKILLYSVGWLLFVWAQAQNSILSTANGLSGWTGFKKWLRMQSVNLATRAFFSALLYGFVVQRITQLIASAGLALTGVAVAGLAGYAANTVMYQGLGLMAKVIPGLRVEVQDLVPPSAAASPTGLADTPKSPGA